MAYHHSVKHGATQTHLIIPDLLHSGSTTEFSRELYKAEKDRTSLQMAQTPTKIRLQQPQYPRPTASITRPAMITNGLLRANLSRQQHAAINAASCNSVNIPMSIQSQAYNNGAQRRYTAKDELTLSATALLKRAYQPQSSNLQFSGRPMYDLMFRRQQSDMVRPSTAWVTNIQQPSYMVTHKFGVTQLRYQGPQPCNPNYKPGMVQYRNKTPQQHGLAYRSKVVRTPTHQYRNQPYQQSRRVLWPDFNKDANDMKLLNVENKNDNDGKKLSIENECTGHKMELGFASEDGTDVMNVTVNKEKESTVIDLTMNDSDIDYSDNEGSTVTSYQMPVSVPQLTRLPNEIRVKQEQDDCLMDQSQLFPNNQRQGQMATQLNEDKAELQLSSGLLTSYPDLLCMEAVERTDTETSNSMIQEQHSVGSSLNGQPMQMQQSVFLQREGLFEKFLPQIPLIFSPEESKKVLDADLQNRKGETNTNLSRNFAPVAMRMMQQLSPEESDFITNGEESKGPCESDKIGYYTSSDARLRARLMKMMKFQQILNQPIFVLNDQMKALKPYMISGWLSDNYLRALMKQKNIFDDSVDGDDFDNVGEVRKCIVKRCMKKNAVVFTRELVYRIFTLGELENIGVKFQRLSTRKMASIKRCVKREFPDLTQKKWTHCCLFKLKCHLTFELSKRVRRVQAFWQQEGQQSLQKNDF